MAIAKHPNNHEPEAEPDGPAEPAAAQPPNQPHKSGAVGCVFAGVQVRIGERSPEAYAAYLEEL